ncbi:MAG: hypothetical protein JXX28_05055 [Deltaproteobacteria bacterium]|nr:hypothetical protein [Deltaproteobacteria bacterium]
MRAMLILSAVLFLGGCDSFGDVKKADTIEAYETYLQDHETGQNALIARSRLEELYYEKAKADGTPESWETFFEKYPEGKGFLYERAHEKWEEFLFNWAMEQQRPEAWDRFLKTFDRPTKEHLKVAERARNVSTYAEHLTLSPVRMERINLAEDPDGPLDGWSFMVDVSNTGDKALSTLELTLSYLDDRGNSLDRDTWAVAAPFFSVPVEEEYYKPLMPQEQRTWIWTSGDTPEGWSQKVKVHATHLVYAEK